MTEKLKTTIERLNLVTDKFMKYLTDLDLDLAEMGIGVHVELPGLFCDDWSLGYGRINNEWHITVTRKEETIELLKAPRKVRIAATYHAIPALITALDSKAKEYIEEIERAIVRLGHFHE